MSNADPWSRHRNRPHLQLSGVVETPCIKGAECPHKHEVVRLKQRLQDSLKETQSFMSESNVIVDTMREQYEKSNTILEDEIRFLKEKINILESKNDDLIKMNTEKLNELDKQLIDTENKLHEVEKKEEPSKESAFERLYRNGKRKPSLTTKK